VSADRHVGHFERYLADATAAVFDGSGISSFGDPIAEFKTARAGEGKFPLLSLGVVRFGGADAQKFLNAQFTTNCLEIDRTHAQFSGWCDPKGRVLFLFVLYTDGESFYAVLPRNQIEHFISRLRMFVLRAEVAITDASSEYAGIGLVGPAPADSAYLEEPWACVIEPGLGHVLRYGPGQPRFLVLVPADAAAAYWQRISAPCAGEACWRALDACAGLPRLEDVTRGEYLPQQLNLDVLNALSFSKGCYPGQEIVARLKYRGEVKKRLAVGIFAATDTVATHAPLRAPGDGATIGRVLYAEHISSRKTIVAAVIDVGIDIERVAIGGAADADFALIDLPYAAA